jgi:pantoate--beta-alanine ligase
MEGAHRPGHFDGVLTVVMKLLLLVRADRAYFGEKDRQQLLLVRDMAAAFFLPTEIVPCPTVRAEDGLALSSRNARLSPAARAKAPEFARILREERDPAAARARLERAGFEVDYVEQHDAWRFGAVRLENVRLIDNVRSENPV